MTLFPALTPFRKRLLLLIVLAACLTLVAAWSAAGGAKPTFDARCETWDVAASVAVADLVADHSPVVEQRLGDAVFRLRRARKYCRYGLVDLARLDYAALLDGRYAGYRQRPDRTEAGPRTEAATVSIAGHE